MMNKFDFIAKRSLFLRISGCIMVIGIILNIILGTTLDISFKGGTLLKYSFSGTVDKAAVQKVADAQFKNASVEIDSSGVGDTNMINISMTDESDMDSQAKLCAALQKAFPDNKINQEDAHSLSPSNGSLFLIKCLVAVVLASLFMLIYVGLRFRKIGGFPAGVMALMALLHDLLIVYFVFVIARIPLNDNFVAVVLTILGYSLNDTIVIFDRVRENRAKMGSKATIDEIVNISVRQSFVRTMNTSITTLLAIGTIAVAAMINGISSIVSFAVPLLFGTLSGFYSSVFLCTPMWAWWIKRREAKLALKK